jgi:hypothetical protein
MDLKKNFNGDPVNTLSPKSMSGLRVSGKSSMFVPTATLSSLAA